MTGPSSICLGVMCNLRGGWQAHSTASLRPPRFFGLSSPPPSPSSPWSPPPLPDVTFRDVFAVREFRALWSSEILSMAGDRLALVALTLLVYDRTRSPLLAAAAFAAGYLPWVIGGLFLADLTDRYPRRSVIVTCDVARAVLVGVMVLHGHAPVGAGRVVVHGHVVRASV